MFLVLVLSVLYSSVVYAANGVVYENKEVTTITSGVTYEKSQRVYHRGIVNVYALKIDLKNPNVGLKVLPETDYMGTTDTVRNLAVKAGAVAAINADFFNMGVSQSSLGVSIKDGNANQLHKGHNSESVKLAGVYIDSSFNAFCDYLINTAMSFSSSKGVLDIKAKNKNYYMDAALYFDKTSMSTSEGLDRIYKNLVKIVVENDVITYISKPSEVVSLPDKGYIITLGVTGVHSLGLFAVGDRVSFAESDKFYINTSVDIANLELGIGGGGIILRNGKIVSEGLIIEQNKRHPRTAVGVSKDKSQLILLAIDGRGASIGATSDETAQILSEYGAYDGIHFDGGGSTTLAVREPGYTSSSLANQPSEGTQRKVANALGVFSNSEPGSLSSLVIKTDNADNVLFASSGTVINVTALDQNFNPIDVDLSGAVYENNGIAGTWNKNIFTPSNNGVGTISVTVGGVKSTINVYSVSALSSFSISPATLNLDAGGKSKFTLTAYNGDGFSKNIQNTEATWSISSDIATVDQNGNITAGANAGIATVSATVNGITVKAEIAIGTYSKLVTGFEDNTSVSFVSYPEYVTGNTTVQPKSDTAQADKVIQLVYAFSSNEVSQAAYIKLNSNNTFPVKPHAISVDVKSDGSGNEMRIQLVDADGKLFYLPLGVLDYDGWKKLTASVPSDAKAPLKIDKIYVLNKGTTDYGKVFVDNIFAAYRFGLTANPQAASGNKDQMNVLINGTVQNGLDIAIFGETVANKAYKQQKDNLLSAMTKSAELLMFIGRTDITTKTPAIKWVGGFSLNGYAGTIKTININATGNGIIKNDASAISALERELNNTTAPYLFVMLNNDLWNGMTKGEAELVHNILKSFTLKTQKKVLVFMSSASANNNITVKDGVRYITINPLNSDGTYVGKQFMHLRIDNGKLTYNFKNL